MQSYINYNDKNMSIEILPYYFLFNDMYNTVYDLKEVKGLYTMDNIDDNTFGMDLKPFTEYLIILCVGINHKEIKIYYKDKESRNKDFISILKILTDKKLIDKENK